MKRVFKYPLEVTDQCEIEMPLGAEILTVQSQYGTPHIWAMVDDDQLPEKRTFCLIGTGHPICHDTTQLKYIGTFQKVGGTFIGHVFERKS